MRPTAYVLENAPNPEKRSINFSSGDDYLADYHAAFNWSFVTNLAPHLGQVQSSPKLDIRVDSEPNSVGVSCHRLCHNSPGLTICNRRRPGVR